MIKIFRNTAVPIWVGKLLALFAEHRFQNPVVLGGHVVVVEVDENKFGKSIQKRWKFGTWLGGERDK